MRFKIVLERTKNDILPTDHQYALASWIYQSLHRGNSEFATWLHDKGYSLGNKQFKLFCFSKPFFPFKPMGEITQMTGREAHFHISFVAEEAVEPFIIGLFQSQSLTLGNSKHKVEFQIKSVEKIPDPDFSSGKSQFILRSPLCLSIRSETKNTPVYLSPDNPHYADYLKSNLLNKYNAIYTDSPLENVPFSFRILNEPRSKLIHIREGESSETKVRGFLFSFEISTAKELLSLAYSSGFGEKNSMGFGFVDKKDMPQSHRITEDLRKGDRGIRGIRR